MPKKISTTTERREQKKPLALWAADCAERVLPIFERSYPDDKRPREAIKIARGWVKGKATISEARKASSAAHAAARKAHEPARAAARAAGYAAATAHAGGHAQAAGAYAAKAVFLAASASALANERAWQDRQLPKDLRV